MWVNNLTWILYVIVVIDIEPIRERFSTVAPFLDERGRRLVAAAEAFAAGYGGISAGGVGTGKALGTIGRGLEGMGPDETSGGGWRAGGGGKAAVGKGPALGAGLEGP